MTTPLRKESSSFNKIRAKIPLLCLMLAVVGLGNSPVHAQPVITAENMGLGGGGTAYLNGPEATYWNPANLMIQGHPGQFHLEIGQGAIQFQPLRSSRSLSQQFANFLDGYQPYTQVAADISPKQQGSILNTHFSENKLQSLNQQRADLILAGAIWQQRDYALSVALRARYASTIKTGRGWYEDEFTEHNGRQIRDFSLIQHRSEFYELAVGYAQEFTFVNGLMPRLNTLYIGIAPKIILAGPAFDASYNARYIRDSEESRNSTFVSDFSMQSSGRFSGTTTDYLQSRNPRRAIKNNFRDNYHYQQTGYGVGFDFGLNYVIPLSSRKGNDPNSSASPAVDNSLRIAFSLNDIGTIRYHSQPLRMSSAKDSSQAQLPVAANTMFVGAGGQYISYLHEAPLLPNPLITAEQESDEPYSALLPTSINTGVLLELEQFKFMGDLTLGLHDTAFTTTNLGVRLGTEIRPLPGFPIRLGTRFASEQPLQVGLGSGIETNHWDFNVGARALFRQESAGATLVGAAFGGLQLHF
ncbi:DUF5723 family protein [Fodinibius sp.]|uniref:DUF5723 family protein n=1 Tax=Fodinibius sp. TaxID=1872440 RepID=UPI0035645879